MWVYWLLLILPAGFSVVRAPMFPHPPQRWPGLWWAAFFSLLMVIGFRHEVGGDWFNYLDQIGYMRGVGLADALSNLRNDFSYTFLSWVVANYEVGGVYFMNFICAAFFSWGLIEFCRAQPRPWLALTAAIPYLVIVVAMGYTRQGVAIGAVMLGLVALSEQRILKFLMFIALAATFHKTAVVLMPLAIFSISKNRTFSVLLIGLFFGLFYGFFLQDAMENFSLNYIQAKYESSGAGIRVAMNAVPALLFLLLRRRFLLNDADRIFWTWMSIGGLGFVFLLYVSPSSTAVDRMALYWIPLQLFVLSRLPEALGGLSQVNTRWTSAVVAYCVAVQFVWLFFAQTAFAWLPYRFYPWEALWS